MIIKKTEEEIRNIGIACRVAAEVLEELKKKVKPGITTAEIDEAGEKLLLKKGAIPAFKGYRGYKHAVCVSVNEEVVHGIPGRRIIKEGDIVGLDVGSIVNGFYGDVAATVAAGKTDKEALDLIKVCRECLELGIKKCVPQNHLGDVSAAIEKRAKASGYSVVRDLYGHGLGRSLHEDPLVANFGTPGSGPKLVPGMVFTLEPMVNAGGSEIETLSDGWTVVTLDRSLSAHFEHAVVVTEDGPVILTVL